jgi:hypothetical protein
VAGLTGVVLFLTVLLASAGVLVDKSFYEKSLQDAHAYDRFYTQILADKKFNDVTDKLLGSLPIDKSLVTSNLRVIIPPSTLRALVGSTISSLTAYLRNQRWVSPWILSSTTSVRWPSTTSSTPSSTPRASSPRTSTTSATAS